MSTVKISQLEEITHLNSNTANTLIVGVDIPSGVTGKITATTLAHGLYSHNPLNVGLNEDTYPNTIAQFAGTSNNYIQVNLENINNDYGTADYIVGANTGSDTTLYLDLGFANKSFNNVHSYNGLTTSLYPLDGYLYVMGNTGGQPGGNLVIGTASAHREIRFIAEGTNTENIVVRINSTELALRNSINLKFNDDTIQTTAAATNAYSMAAYAQANNNIVSLNSANSWLQANDSLTLSSALANDTVTLGTSKAYTDSANSWLVTYVNTGPAYLRANAAYAQANAAYNQANTAIGDFNVLEAEVSALTSLTMLVGTTANNALQNTTGIFAGDLTITGNTQLNRTLHVQNSSLPGNTQHVLVTGTANGVIGVPSNPGYTFHSAIDGNGNRIVSESYGTGSSIYSAFIGRRGRGTAEAPSAVQTGDIITRLGGNGYGATKFSQFSDARIEFVATETHTDASKGTHIQFWVTESGSNVATQIGSMTGNTVFFAGTVNPQKGFIFSANVNGTVLAKTIDFSKDSLIKFDVNDNATISLSNYVAGKVVEVWITNSAAQNKTITHGCLATNSTAKSTTFTILAQSCAYLRYFSIDGDQANTYVSINA